MAKEPRTFKLTAIEQRRADSWWKRHIVKCRGSIMMHTFRGSSGIGTSVIIGCHRCGKEKNISDYDSW